MSLSDSVPMASIVPDRQRWVKRAISLSVFTVAYNCVEGVVSIGFGLTEDSIALAGFGFDSFIEVFSALAVLWRFKGESGIAVGPALEKERRATTVIGALFLLLSLGTVAGALLQLGSKGHPQTTIPGLVISSVSLSFMFVLWKSKLQVGRALDSMTMIKDAACSLACIKLSGVLLVGSLIYWIAPALWWADSLAALLIAVFVAREGMDTIRNARSGDFSGGCCGCD